MQFAFTEDQETLRREARDVLANGGWGRRTRSPSSASSTAPSSTRRPDARTAARSSSTTSAPENEQLAALSLEAVGIGAKALELAIEYAKTREQFGKPIGTYQAVSHQLADTYVETELARSLAYWAAWCVAEGDEQVDVACAAAKAYCGDAAVAACERSIQVHGGIGFTWEHVLHEYYKRALVDPGVRRLRGEASRAHRRAPARLRTVLVTGASSGIGAACAVRLRDRGWRVLAGVRRAGTAPEGTEELLVDVTDPPALELVRAGRARQQRRHRGRRAARVPAAGRASPPARGERRRAAAR